ncbi:Polyphosphate:AMP phosphotransferase [Calothrix sp. PCC 7716]|nr:Polyphosphate:AMP phosphotransferase [Calothrix sp. PCC 7716]
MNHDNFIAKPGAKFSLKDYDPEYTAQYGDKTDASEKLRVGIERIGKYQDILYAHDQYALLIIFQAMDAAGKDSTIKHVMSGINPQGCQVYSFKSPSTEELDHDFLWRSTKALPERGRIGIFNRSYYEEVLIARVHPHILLNERLPHSTGKKIWKQRFEDINNYEKYLTNNGIVILKFFLNISKSEQKRRFLRRIELPEKNWKFSMSDVEERAYWDDYMEAYEDVFNHTSTDWAPWYIIPSNHKWFARLAVADIICSKLKQLDLEYPTLSDEHRHQLLKAKAVLESEAS